MNKVKHPFWVIVHKEIADHVHSLRFIILISIIVLTCMGALYTALTNIGAAIKPDDPDVSFFETFYGIGWNAAFICSFH